MSMRETTKQAIVIAFRICYVVMIVGLTFIYIGLKGATGHQFVWYWNELAAFQIAVASVVVEYLSSVKYIGWVLQSLSLVLYIAMLVLFIWLVPFVFSIDYGDDTFPLLFYGGAIACVVCTAGNTYFALIRIVRSSSQK